MAACIGQEATSPIVPSSRLSIDLLTDRNRHYCCRFPLNLNRTSRSFAFANWKNNFKLLKYASDFPLIKAVVLCDSLSLIRFRRHVSVSTSSRYWAFVFVRCGRRRCEAPSLLLIAADVSSYPVIPVLHILKAGSTLEPLRLVDMRARVGFTLIWVYLSTRLFQGNLSCA